MLLQPLALHRPGSGCCNLVPFGPELRWNLERLAGDSRAVPVAGWGEMTCEGYSQQKQSPTAHDVHLERLMIVLGTRVRRIR
jgi:hypothetical protein